MGSSRRTPQISGRNLIVLSDGTGNRGGVTRDTNVWRLYKTIDRHHAPVEQLVRYDDGVGTDDWRVAKLLGGAFGYGLTRNVTGLYAFLVRHYRPGDRIYMLGFSRGAFTVRVLAGLIARCGLWTWKAYFDEDDPENFIRKKILPAYRSLGDRKVRKMRESADLHPEVYVRFLGVWDTVDAVGVPIDELKYLLEILPRLFANRRGYGFHDRKLSRWIHTARQALSIDDDRRTFHPNVWSTLRPSEQRENLCNDVKQVWFAGAHSNVGGSYPKDGLAFITLDWMLGETDALGRDRIWLEGDTVTPHEDDEANTMAIFEDDTGQRFAVQSPARIAIQQQADAHGRHYEPRSGPGLVFRYQARLLEQAYTGEGRGWARWLKYLPEFVQKRIGISKLTRAPRKIPVHVSAHRRLLQGTQDYAPYVLPANVNIAYTQGPSPFSAERGSRPLTLPDADKARREARVPVCCRPVGYWLTFFGTVLLIVALFQLPVSDLVNLVRNPGFDQVPPLLTQLVDGPWLQFALALIVPGVLLSLWAKSRIRQRSQAAWREVLLRNKMLP